VIIDILYQSLFLRLRRRPSKVNHIDLLLGNLGNAGMLLVVTVMLFALQSWLLEHDQGVKVNFT